MSCFTSHLFFSSVTKCICVSKLSHALCWSSGSSTQDSLRPQRLHSRSLLYALSPRKLNMGTRATRNPLPCMVLPSPGTPRAQLKQRQWGDSVSLLFKEEGKINHSGWAFVPIYHGVAITIPFSTPFVSQSKASGCDSESDSFGRLFMQLNHYNPSNLKWHHWRAHF